MLQCFICLICIYYISRVTGALSRDRMESAVTEEVKMNTQDQNEADRLVAKNSVEEYIYEIR